MRAKQHRNPERAERRLIYMSSQQLARIRRLSARTGISQQALMARGIEMVLSSRGGK
jgi:hypothetical protein